MLTFLALILWLLAICAGFADWLATSAILGSVGFWISGKALAKRDDMEAFFGSMLMAGAVLTIAQLVDAALP